ncbi:DUF2975 domain-containing protein [Sphingomicrobium clamense]|uniref:DUF2975 domain-containing protein n=1 Tax=Sphingomicrobium clamense TaxID=2851013 RepID=A0ABS6V4Q6_9SPHN|nr:DUF2975 domain-containing protein [Sphingomicrobium sp. B8]MBW0144542.1 DUF2975 domain-containing protein [Sphingomicrobium sp. B8]
MTQGTKRDGLLATLRLFIKFLRGLSVIGMVLLGGIAIIFAVLPPSGLEDVGKDMTKLHALALSFMLIGAVAILVMLFVALGKLLEIVATVEEGDPFVPENAERLERMAWLATYTIPIMVVIVGLAVWLKGVVEGIELDAQFDFGVVLLALFLFVLARVFRHGTEMRRDLEGTV